VYEKLDAETVAYADEFVGFPDSAVDRIVPPVENNPDKPLDVVVEEFYEWSVERCGFRGEIPNIPAMHIVEDLMAYLERKLFTLNTGHCITAYLGSLKGYETIDQAIADEKIYTIVRGAMTESGEGLIMKHGFKPEAHWSYMASIINRYRNPYLKDALVRIGREPNTKLAPTDRLIAPLMNSYSYGIPVDNLIKGIAAALHFDYEGDVQSQALQEKIREKGLIEAVKEITGITDTTLLNKISSAYDTIVSEIQ
jgi:mannitol-1-phosphate 5-dehydrogenase